LTKDGNAAAPTVNQSETRFGSSQGLCMPKTQARFVGVFATALLLLLSPTGVAQELGTLQIEVHQRNATSPVAARIHLRTAEGAIQKAPHSPFETRGTPVLPSEFPHHFDHFTIPGKAQLQLSPGKYLINIEKGPEFRVERRRFEIRSGVVHPINVQTERWINMKDLGWWSGEMHIHRPVDDAQLLVEAEDIHISPWISHWNGKNIWEHRTLPGSSMSEVSGDRWVQWFSAEDERQGGGVLMLNLHSPIAPGIPALQFGREFPSPLTVMKHAQMQKGAWLDIEKPFWWDMPCWIASGLIDSIGIANNHMNRDQVRDDEAWGRPRDRDEFPGTHGNGLYSQFLYYQILNAGIQIPPSAGSASGVLPNPVGYNRAYVLVEGKFNYDKWWQEFARGRVFVTNGPMLMVTANGRPPGERFRISEKKNEKLVVQLNVRVAGNDPIEAVEVIVDGDVIQRITNPGENVAPKPFEIRRSSWFLVRAIAAVPETFRFASTGPFYVQVGSKASTIHREAVNFFLKWIDQRIAAIRRGDPQKLNRKDLASVLAPHFAARRVFETLQRNATP
jgi:hypothetical protein